MRHSNKQRTNDKQGLIDKRLIYDEFAGDVGDITTTLEKLDRVIDELTQKNNLRRKHRRNKHEGGRNNKGKRIKRRNAEQMPLLYW